MERTGNAWDMLLFLIIVAVIMELPVFGEQIAWSLTMHLADQERYDREFAEIVATYE